MADPEKGEAEPSKAAQRAAAARRAVLEAAARQEGVDPTVAVDRRKKSRNKQVAENAEKAAAATAPLGHSLRTMESNRVAQMAAAAPEPDWENNPDDLDTPAEVREDLKEDGLDPMDVENEEEAMFGHFLVHAYADDNDLGGRTREQLEAEHDMTVEAMREHGINHDSPLDPADIEGGQAEGDAFGVGIDMSMDGSLGFGGED